MSKKIIFASACFLSANISQAVIDAEQAGNAAFASVVPASAASALLAQNPDHPAAQRSRDEEQQVVGIGSYAMLVETLEKVNDEIPYTLFAERLAFASEAPVLSAAMREVLQKRHSEAPADNVALLHWLDQQPQTFCCFSAVAVQVGQEFAEAHSAIVPVDFDGFAEEMQDKTFVKYARGMKMAEIEKLISILPETLEELDLSENKLTDSAELRQAFDALSQKAPFFKRINLDPALLGSGVELNGQTLPQYIAAKGWVLAKLPKKFLPKDEAAEDEA